MRERMVNRGIVKWRGARPRLLTGDIDPWNTLCGPWDREGYLLVRSCRFPSVMATGQGPPRLTLRFTHGNVEA